MNRVLEKSRLNNQGFQLGCLFLKACNFSITCVQREFSILVKVIAFIFSHTFSYPKWICLGIRIYLTMLTTQKDVVNLLQRYCRRCSSALSSFLVILHFMFQVWRYSDPRYHLAFIKERHYPVATITHEHSINYMLWVADKLRGILK